MATKILVIEDNPITSKMVRVTLETEGYKVLEAPDGKTGLSLAVREKPALILQDLLLPDMDGFELVARLRALPEVHDVPILAFTGFLSRIEEARISNVGFTDLLLKPVEPSRLVRVVDSYVVSKGKMEKKDRRGHPVRLLLVDDDPIQLKLQRAVLSNAGYMVTVAGDGIEALELAQKNTPDFIVSDVLMPRMDGFRLTAAVRGDKKLARTPIVLASSQYVNPEDHALALKLGAQDFVIRTPGLSELIRAVTNVLAAPVFGPPPDDPEALNRTYFERVLLQLDRQATINVGLTQRASLQSSALAILGAITETVSRGTDVEARLQEVLAQCIDAAGLSRGAVVLKDVGQGWRCAAQLGYESAKPKDLDGFFGHGALLERIVAGDRTVVIAPDDRADPDAADFLERAGASTALVAPLVSLGSTVGALLFVSANRKLGGDEWKSFAQAVASQLGQGIALSRAFSSLVHTEKRYRAVFEGSPAGLYRVTTTGQGLEANPEFLRILGYESVDQFRAEYTPGRHADAKPYERLRELIRREGVTNFEMQFRRVDGGTFWGSVSAREKLDEAGCKVIEGTLLDITARREADDRIRWLTAAVEQNPAAIFMTRLDGTIEYVNNTYTEVTGYSAAEAIGRKPSLIKSGHTPPEYYQSLWSTILAGKSWRSEVQNRRKNGEIYWDSVMISPIRDTQGVVTHFLAVQRDITEQKRLQEALRESDERHRLLFDNSPHPMWVIDAATFRFLAVNATAEQRYGYSKAEFLGMTALDIRPVEDRARFSASMREPSGGVRLTAEWRHCKKDGTLMDVEISVREVVFEGRPALLALVVDVSARKVAEAALRESEERFRQIAENTQEVFFLTELQSGRVIYLNPAFERLWGVSVEAVYRRSELWFENIHPDDRPTVAAELGRERAGGTSNVIFRVVRPDSSIRWARARAFPIVASDRLVGLVEDITDLKRAEEQATQAQKMEAVGRLAGGVAHDFNNLLTVIMGEVELMQIELPPPAQIGESLAEIRKASERAVGLTRQLLAFSRKQLVEPTVFKANDLVTEMGKMLQRLIGEDVRLSINVAPDPGSVKADRGQIEQVLVNLIVNARDAMPSGGSITIETRCMSLDDEYARDHPYAPPGEYVVLAVSDTGTGMPPEVKAQIFEPFFTTKEQGKGTGLGLATSYGIVKQAGGHIAVYSEVGHGSTFKVYLPRVVEDATGEFAVAAPIPTGHETILLVEDDVSVRAVAARVLKAQGYSVLEADNGKEAWRIAEGDGKIDLLLTDVVLPGVGGREIAEGVSALRPGIKVLFATGYTDDVVLQNKLLSRDVNLIQKPFTRDGLARKVREVLDAPRKN